MSDLVTSFVQARNYTPVTGGRRIDLIVLHSMESPEKPSTAEDVANWFAGPNAPQASAHYCIDSNSIVQCVKDTDVAWHAPGVNHDGLGLEHAGRASQTPHDWDDPYSRAELKLSAKLAADLCRRYRIPAVYLRAADLIANRRGITTHLQATVAFSGGMGHTDPGPGFPISNYVADVTANLTGGPQLPPPPILVKPPLLTLRRGSTGWQVTKLQKLLAITPDRAFGAKTEQAVKTFQQQHHLPADGVVGDITWGALLHTGLTGG